MAKVINKNLSKCLNYYLICFKLYFSFTSRLIIDRQANTWIRNHNKPPQRKEVYKLSAWAPSKTMIRCSRAIVKRDWLHHEYVKYSNERQMRSTPFCSTISNETSPVELNVAIVTGFRLKRQLASSSSNIESIIISSKTIENRFLPYNSYASIDGVMSIHKSK